MKWHPKFGNEELILTQKKSLARLSVKLGFFFPKLNVHTSCILVSIALQVSPCPAGFLVSLGRSASAGLSAPWLHQPGLGFSF